MVRSKYAQTRRVRCPLCQGWTYSKLPLIRKTQELVTAEQLKRKTSNKSAGTRRVCPKCWFNQTIISCSIEEVAAAVIHLSSLTTVPEGWGRGYLNELSKIIIKMTDDNELLSE